MKPPIGRDTRLCMSLSGRPGNAGSRFHNYLYEILGLDYVYKSFSTQDLAAAIGGIRALEIRGCAISMPFKEAVIPLMDDLESSARVIDSVNTIVNDGGRLTGYNTDYVAVRRLLERRIDKPVPFLLRGSGGMAKAVAAALRDAGFADGTIIARNEVAGQAIADQYGYRWRTDLPRDSAPLLINVTPLGMDGKDSDTLAFNKDQIAACNIAFDVVAQPINTPFVRAARAARKNIISGGEIIVLQAVEQFILYTGIRPEADDIREATRYAHGADVAARIAD
ncbi:shikimate 5-dehydrogenase [Sphingobium sp. TB-6]|uniref:shikimate 5-dehydrogenase n=1 Tax=Sphingobium sp. TB-6 TaxID=2728850 RepID=UPI00146F3F7F|nr:shikimate 5-dehydrogenase [Sphingobium sp. TB-6]NML87469.1 shikimate 5-dehydrogenase [Sphingobium sp. TB-6]